MRDDKTQTAPQDAARVNVKEVYQVRSWTHKSGCTKEQLKPRSTRQACWSTPWKLRRNGNQRSPRRFVARSLLDSGSKWRVGV
jgi:hypothetical protein